MKYNDWQVANPKEITEYLRLEITKITENKHASQIFFFIAFLKAILLRVFSQSLLQQQEMHCTFALHELFPMRRETF